MRSAMELSIGENTFDLHAGDCQLEKTLRHRFRHEECPEMVQHEKYVPYPGTKFRLSVHHQ